MGNLLSKIMKPVIISFLSLSLLTGIKAQKKIHLNCHFSAGAETGISYSKRLEPYEGWKDNFVPPRKGMDFERYGRNPALDIYLGIEPSIKMWDFELGFPVNFYASNLIPSIIKEELYLNWWDQVKFMDSRIKKQTPALGVSARFETNRNSDMFLDLQYLTYKYIIKQRLYQGEDCINCANTSEIFEKRKIRDNQIHRFSIGLSDDNEYWKAGVYLKKDEGFSEWGIYANANIETRKILKELKNKKSKK